MKNTKTDTKTKSTKIHPFGRAAASFEAWASQDNPFEIQTR